MKSLLASLALLAISSIACSSSKGSDPAAGGADAGFVPLAASPTTFVIKNTIAAGQEAFKCTYMQMPATAGFIVGGHHQYTPGSHHLLMYRTDLKTIPAGEGSDVVADCYEGTADYMSHIRGVVYPAATPTGGLSMPAGIGLPYVANEIFLFQVHYVNANAKDLATEADVHLDTVADGITTNAGILFFYDPFIDVPVGGKSRAQMRCPIPKDVTVLTTGSHYHARGVDYAAYLDPANGPAATTPFYTSQDWASPLISNTPMTVPAGSHVRFSCSYDNTHGIQEYVQGPSAHDNEMCMFIALYYPAMTAAEEQCDNADQYGAGTVACGASLSCLQACPPGGNNQSTGEFTPCVQKCFVDSCPTATPPLLAALSCINSKCATQCASGGSACTSCVGANCAAEYTACSSQACQ